MGYNVTITVRERNGYTNPNELTLNVDSIEEVNKLMHLAFDNDYIVLIERN